MSRTVSGRPVRFFVVLMGGWTIMRLGSAASSMLWPASVQETSPLIRPVAAHRGIVPMGRQEAAAATSSPWFGSVMHPPSAKPGATLPAPLHKSAGTSVRRARHGSGDMFSLALQSHAAGPAPAKPDASASPSLAPAVPLTLPGQTQPDRWRGSAWLLWRDGSASGADIVTAGRLGGSQVGVRVDYDLSLASAGRVSAYGRASAALNRPASPEAAIGLAWQPSRAIPISIAAERRIALGKGARDANALLAVGGFGPTPIVAGLEAEAYAQAGLVGFHNRDLFADGKLSLLSPIARLPIRLGASLSGGAQPGVERLDIGPEMQLRLPLPQVAARLRLEWRERVAGRASPPSGLAVTLGADF